MNKFSSLNWERIKNGHTPSIVIKRQIKNMLQCSRNCSATVEFVEENTGKYRIVLEGQLSEGDNLDSSYYIG